LRPGDARRLVEVFGRLSGTGGLDGRGEVHGRGEVRRIVAHDGSIVDEDGILDVGGVGEHLALSFLDSVVEEAPSDLFDLRVGGRRPRRGSGFPGLRGAVGALGVLELPRRARRRCADGARPRHGLSACFDLRLLGRAIADGGEDRSLPGHRRLAAARAYDRCDQHAARQDARHDRSEDQRVHPAQPSCDQGDEGDHDEDDRGNHQDESLLTSRALDRLRQ
jgi:hypothetical protein